VGACCLSGGCSLLRGQAGLLELRICLGIFVVPVLILLALIEVLQLHHFEVLLADIVASVASTCLLQ